MLLNRLGMLCALAIIPAVAQVSGVSSKPVAQESLRQRHGPMKLAVQRDDGSVESYNWSGYAVTGTSFTKATGSWIEPAFTCNNTKDEELAAFWVGIDGYANGTVEQIGTQAQCVNGHEQHYAWWELYPLNYEQEIRSIKVSAGDRISTAVIYNATTGNFTLTITDETTGKKFSKTGTQSGTEQASVEWIAEAPCCLSSGAYYPIPDFGMVLFGKDSTGIAKTNFAADSSHAGAFNTFPSGTVIPITMINSGTGATEAVPSNPSSDGSSFSVQWVSP